MANPIFGLAVMNLLACFALFAIVLVKASKTKAQDDEPIFNLDPLDDNSKHSKKMYMSRTVVSIVFSFFPVVSFIYFPELMIITLGLLILANIQFLSNFKLFMDGINKEKSTAYKRQNMLPESPYDI
jgi:hypothetical protein